MKKIITIFILFIVWLVPVCIIFKNIFSGSIPFWYDPARDLALAWDNLKKPTLIGSPTGIPGLFYGPYWIWLISVVLFFTKDPRFVSFFILALPYLIIAPIIFYLLSKKIGKLSAVTLWSLFILSSINYATFIWNPHLAPLSLLVLIYFLVNTKNNIRTIIVGLLIGLILNLHLSLGIVITFAIIIYQLILFISSKKLLEIKNLLLMLLGISILFLPTLIFEKRHGFNQIKSVMSTIENAYLYKTASVGQVGLDKEKILTTILDKFGQFFQISSKIALIFFLVSLFLLIILIIKKKIKIEKIDKKIILFCCCFFISLLLVYLTSKNPVWEYHFIGIEIIFLFIIYLIVRYLKATRIIIFAWIIFLWGSKTLLLAESFFQKQNPLLNSSLYTKEYILKIICGDSVNKKFFVSIFSPQIYTFDYDYLFKWFTEEKKCRKQEVDISNATQIYLIIPKTENAKYLDFIDYRTPNRYYRTMEEWKIDDGTTIIKRTKINYVPNY